MARHAVGRGWADECLVRIAYAIGEAAPIAVSATSGADDLAARFAAECLDLHRRLRPGEIIRRLGLKRPLEIRQWRIDRPSHSLVLAE